VKLGRDFIAVALLDQPFVDAHQAKAKAAVLFANGVDLVVGELGAKRAADEELRRQFESHL
jgi:hypothetical protein